MPTLVKTQLIGQHIRQLSFKVDYTELVDASTGQAFVFKVLGAEDMQVIGTSWELITAFTDAGSISAVGVTVGDGSDVDAWGVIADVFTTAGTYAGGMTAPNTKAAGASVTATFTATGANFGDGAVTGLDTGGVVFTMLIAKHLKAS